MQGLRNMILGRCPGSEFELPESPSISDIKEHVKDSLMRCQEANLAKANGTYPPKLDTEKTLSTIRKVSTALRQLVEDRRDQSDIYQQQELEEHLSKVEALEEEYELNDKLRRGIRSMASAYSVSRGGKSRRSALANVKAGYRELTLTLIALEQQITDLLGTLQFTIKGIEGWARLCPGDVYEIRMKHASQKWKTRTKVTKDGSQNWDNGQWVVRPLISEQLSIAASEIKTLARVSLLADKCCELGDLFSPEPQLMTLNLNPSGSLKLHLLVSWTPLGETFVMPDNYPTGTMTTIKSSKYSYCSSISLSSQSNSIETSPTRNNNNSANSSSSSSSRKITNSASPSELREEIRTLATILRDDIQGHYPQLQMLEVNVDTLRHYSQAEEVWRETPVLNVQSALEAFDFLDEHNSAELPSLHHEERSNGTIDSGVGSLSSSLVVESSKNEFVTGSEDLDAVLSVHIRLCLKLVKNLGTFGPLKWVEREALSSLQEQASILAMVLQRIEQQMSESSGVVQHELIPYPPIHDLWRQIVGREREFNLMTSCGDAVRQLTNLNNAAAKAFVSQIVGDEKFNSESTLTVFQFLHFLRPYQNSLSTLFSDITQEESLLSRLEDKALLNDTLKELSCVPSRAVFKKLLSLISKENDDESDSSDDTLINFILNLAKSRRKQIVESCVRELESDVCSERQGSLILLKALAASEVIQEVAYVAQIDSSSKIRQLAKEMLMSLKEGHRVHAQLTLNSHGFQGLMSLPT